MHCNTTVASTPFVVPQAGVIQLGNKQTDAEVVSSFTTCLNGSVVKKIQCSYQDRHTIIYDQATKVLETSLADAEAIEALKNKMKIHDLEVTTTKPIKMESYKLPVCVAVVIRRKDPVTHKDQILLLERQNTGWMDGYWGVPGGSLEQNESIAEAAARETMEEVGITVDPNDLTLTHVYHIRRGGNKDVMGTMFLANVWRGEAKNAEPNKCREVRWFDTDSLPEKMIEQTRSVFTKAENGIRYSAPTA